MKTIYKYQLDISTNIQCIEMPQCAEILCIQTQNEMPCIWALVDPMQPIKPRTIETFGTGHEIYYDMGIERKYIGTYQICSDRLVLHCFERIN